MSVKLEDFSVEVIEALKDTAIAALHEFAGEIQAQTKNNNQNKK